MRLVVAVVLVVLTACVGQEQSDDPPTVAPVQPTTSSSTSPQASTTTAANADVFDPCADVTLDDPVPITPVDGLVEISGAVFATDFSDGPSLWVHQDSGNPAVLTRVGLDGRVRQSVTLAGIKPYDWEDIAWAARSDSPGTKHLFVADIGDNQRVRDQVEILRFAEPAPGETTVIEIDEIVLLLPHGPADAEALLVDPANGDLIMLAKSIDGRADVLVAPNAAWSEPDAPITLVSAGSIDLGFGNAVLAADVAPTGQVVGVRTPFGVHMWRVEAGQALSNALAKEEPCRAPAPFDIFGEALALSDRGYLLTGESEHPALVAATRPNG